MSSIATSPSIPPARKQCRHPSACPNLIYARGLCVKHGGKRRCAVPDCDQHVKGGRYCIQHGGHSAKRFCSVVGCDKQAHAKGRCVAHGGGQKCKVNGCVCHARIRGCCKAHAKYEKITCASPRSVSDLEWTIDLDVWDIPDEEIFVDDKAWAEVVRVLAL
ncbi:Aste57867_17571 [Aphanomyces stellatus]|uniref:Aste57867_17571 protein n=1 Tax=Aphanomyces stellatus TaxID=120398 RepID=A0A485L8A6_9STRA|nr:hypothetical protein As57867_017511 [Aphanomyces stellatus]VFT94322.1 Aste57867_17571 [Aphanomyces stellatus]